jgi:hypothetical protein
MIERVHSAPNRAAGYPAATPDLLSTLSPSTDYASTPAGIQRNVELASVLEPLVYSPHKTTRSGDCNPDQRLAFFLAAGVNIGEPFRELGERLVQAWADNAGQPLLYDIGLKAQIESKRQRDGGRTNQGIISMLLPLVAAQTLYLEQAPDPTNIGNVFTHLGKVMSRTTIEDVQALKYMESLAFRLSGWKDREHEAEQYGGQTVLEYYEAKRDGTGRVYYKELTESLPRTQDIVAEVLGSSLVLSPEQGFQDIFSAACQRVLNSQPDSYHPHLLADNTAAALYMILSHHPCAEVIF